MIANEEVLGDSGKFSLPWAATSDGDPDAGSATTTLPLNDVNILILTDVHSWVGRQHALHEPDLDVDYGDILSFYHRLQSIVASSSGQQDLFFVMNGDFMDGTGLSRDPPLALVDLIQRMPWDVMNVGNHELYHEETVRYLLEEDNVLTSQARYITSNVLGAATGLPMGGGGRYTFLKGEHTTLLTFGFLYNMMNTPSLVQVERVEEVVASQWFTDVLSGDDGQFDAVLVLSHMGARNELITVILNAVREVCGAKIQVLFVTGHTHKRDVYVPDDNSYSVEAGRYLDTVGFVSFAVKHDDGGGDSGDARFSEGEDAAVKYDSSSLSSFEHVFIDGNLSELSDALGLNDSSELATPEGDEFSARIAEVQNKMGLLETVGCSKLHYTLHGAHDDQTSIWNLYITRILPSRSFLRDDEKALFVQGAGKQMRYDLFDGVLRVTDLFSASPFNNTVVVLSRHVKGSAFLQMLESDTPNVITDPSSGRLLRHVPSYMVSSGGILPGDVHSVNVDADEYYNVFTTGFGSDALSLALKKATSITEQSSPDEIHLVDSGVIVDGEYTADWMLDFVKENWPCDEAASQATPANGLSVRTVQYLVGSLAAASAVLLLALYSWSKTRRKEATHVQTSLEEVNFVNTELTDSLIMQF